MMNFADRILGGKKPRHIRPPTESELTSPRLAYTYALSVLHGRFPQGEQTIVKNPWHALCYAKDIIKGRWPDGETTIKSTAKTACEYAVGVIKGRWPEAEAVILQDRTAKRIYADFLKSIGCMDEDALMALGFIDFV